MPKSTTQASQAPLLAKLRTLLAELHQYEQLYHNQRISFFRPNPAGTQREFFEAQKSAVRLVLGSNRSGKTVVGVAEAIAHALGYRPWLPKDDPHHTVRLCDGSPIPVPNVGRVIAQNFEQAIRQTIIPKFDEWMPRGMLARIEKNTRGIPVCYVLHNGSKIHLMSNDQDDMAFEGPSGHWFWADEPIDYRKYIGLKRGLVDYNGHCWLTMTPLSQPWINDIIVNRAGDPGQNVSMFTFSIWDNCTEVGGHLKREAIEEFLSDLREDELEARLHAKFLHLAGLVYKEWEPRPPYWIEPFDIPISWPRVQLVDPHGRKPLALMWAAISPTNKMYIYRSMFSRGLRTVEDAADFIKQAEGWKASDTPGVEAEPVALRIIDWSAEEEERTSGMSIRGKFSACNLYYVKAKKVNAAYGYDAIHQALHIPDREWAEPGLAVFNTCGEVKQNFMNFCHPDWQSSRQRDIQGEKEGYIKNHDDFVDLIRYCYQHPVSYGGLKGLLNLEFAARDRQENDVSVFQRAGTRTGYGSGVRKWQMY